MAETVETLLIKIGADIIDLKQGMADAKKSVEGLSQSTVKSSKEMESKFASMAKGVVSRLASMAAAVVSAQAAVHAFQKAIADVTALGRLSQTTGIAVDRLSELKFAASESGIEFDTLQQVVSQFGQRMTEAVANPTSRTALALQALGVNVRDAEGNLRNFSDVLPDLADRFAQYADGANKSALASALFGEEAGPRLVPLLNQGRDGLERMADEARRLGLTFGQEGVQKAEEFRRAALSLQAALDGLVRQLAITLAPVLTNILNTWRDIARELKFQFDTQPIRDAAQAWDSARVKVEIARLELEALRKEAELPLVGNVFDPLSNSADTLAQRTEAAKQKLSELEAQAESARQKFLELYNVPSGQLPEAPHDNRPQAPGMGGLSEQMKEAQFQLQEFLTIAQGGGTIAETLALAWEDTSSRIAEAQKRADAAITDSAERQRQMTQIKRNLLKQEEQAYITVAQTAAQALTTLFPKSKAAAIAAAIINTAVGITEALKLPFPLNIAQAALVAAMGAAQIATIRSTSQNGGGSAPSPGGGGGGGGSSPPLQPEEPAPGRAIVIQGMDPAAIFSGRQLEELLSAINHEVQNGATLISTRNIRF